MSNIFSTGVQKVKKLDAIISYQILCWFFTDLSDTNAESDDCIQHCPQLLRPICGSNGQTFGNLCEMKVAMCKDKNKTLTMLHEGSCDDHVSLKIFIKNFKRI